MTATSRNSAAREPGEISDAPLAIPINGELDLHTFQPRDLGRLLPAYLAACQEEQIFMVRIVHGKGTGTLRATVRKFLQTSPAVVSFRTADENNGGWGATVAHLRR